MAEFHDPYRDIFSALRMEGVERHGSNEKNHDPYRDTFSKYFVGDASRGALTGLPPVGRNR